MYRYHLLYGQVNVGIRWGFGCTKPKGAFNITDILACRAPCSGLVSMHTTSSISHLAMGNNTMRGHYALLERVAVFILCIEPWFSFVRTPPVQLAAHSHLCVVVRFKEVGSQILQEEASEMILLLECLSVGLLIN
jgi:hypothetical protein